MRTLTTALMAGFLSVASAAPSSAQIFISDLGTISVPGTAIFGNPDTINGTFDNDFLFTLDTPAPRGAADVIEIELLPTFEIDQFTVSLFEADTSAGPPPVATGPALGSQDSSLIFPPDTHGAVLAFPALDVGSYILNVTGSAIGGQGGSYAGNIALAPLPGAALVLASALIGLAAVRRYRRNDADA